MTRGRKKDLTIPPSRSLTQQRDYRARKANYITELEAHCRKVDQENADLRKELAETRARLANPVVVHPETVQASHELLYNLAMASVSLTKFQQLAFPNAQQPTQSYPKLPDAQTTQSPVSHTRDGLETGRRSQNHSRIGRKRLFTEPDDDDPQSPNFQAASPDTDPNKSDSSEESCCGGYVDCDALSVDGILEGRDNGDNISRVSGMRSTFDYRADIA